MKRGSVPPFPVNNLQKRQYPSSGIALPVKCNVFYALGAVRRKSPCSWDGSGISLSKNLLEIMTFFVY